MTEMTEFSKVRLWKSNPALYLLLLTLSIISLGLGYNFGFERPTFTPYGIHKTIAGVVFFILGVMLIFFLHIHRNIAKLRLTQNISAIVWMIWGLVNTQQWVRDLASLQLPIVFVGGSIWQFIFLIIPVINPVSEKK